MNSRISNLVTIIFTLMIHEFYNSLTCQTWLILYYVSNAVLDNWDTKMSISRRSLPSQSVMLGSGKDEDYRERHSSNQSNIKVQLWLIPEGVMYNTRRVLIVGCNLVNSNRKRCFEKMMSELGSEGRLRVNWTKCGARRH